MSSDLDETDLKLLGLLQRDGLQSMAELSKAIGTAPSTLNDRVKRLGRLGAIRGTYAHIDPVALGLNLLAFVFVGWSDGAVEADFLKRVASADEVLECHHVTGGWNYLIKVRVKDTRALEAFLGSVLKQVKGLQRTETLIALSSPKETTILADGWLGGQLHKWRGCLYSAVQTQYAEGKRRWPAIRTPKISCSARARATRCAARCSRNWRAKLPWRPRWACPIRR